MIELTRDELQDISTQAKWLADEHNSGWPAQRKRAYYALADAADNLNALIARDDNRKDEFVNGEWTERRTATSLADKEPNPYIATVLRNNLDPSSECQDLMLQYGHYYFTGTEWRQT